MIINSFVHVSERELSFTQGKPECYIAYLSVTANNLQGSNCTAKGGSELMNKTILNTVDGQDLHAGMHATVSGNGSGIS